MKNTDNTDLKKVMEKIILTLSDLEDEILAMKPEEYLKAIKLNGKLSGIEMCVDIIQGFL